MACSELPRVFIPGGGFSSRTGYPDEFHEPRSGACAASTSQTSTAPATAQVRAPGGGFSDPEDHTGDPDPAELRSAHGTKGHLVHE